MALSRGASFDEKRDNTVALSGAKLNKRVYLEKHYPHWQIKQYKSDRACVDAVKRGDVDCAIFNSYGIKHIIGAQELSQLQTTALSGSMDLSLAVRNDNPRLHSILERSITLVSRDVLNSSMKSFAEPASLVRTAATKAQGAVWQNKVFLVTSIITLMGVCVVLVVVLFTARNKRTESKLRDAEKQVAELTRQLQEQQNHKN